MSIAMTIFSLLGTFIIGFSMFPQTIATFKSKDTASLSLLLYFMMGIATALITIYGIGLVIIPDPSTNADLAKIIGEGDFNNLHVNWLLSYIVPGAFIIFGELICSVTSFIVAFLKISNMLKAKKLGISEAEYVKRLMAKNNVHAKEQEEVSTKTSNVKTTTTKSQQRNTKNKK